MTNHNDESPDTGAQVGDPVSVASDASLYTCPMHPEIQQVGPGACPKCGMALEQRTMELEEDTSELGDMTRRFWVSAFLAIPVFFSAMAAEFWTKAKIRVRSVVSSAMGRLRL